MWKNDWEGGGEESVKYTFPQQMRIRSDYGSGFKSKSKNLVFGCEFLNLLLSGSGTIQNGSGFRSKFKNPACKTLLCNADPDPLNTDSDYLYFSYYETRSLDILLSKLNFKSKSFKLSKSTVLARVLAHVRACVRVRVHGFVRACMVACALMCLRVCVCACLRAYHLLDLQNYI